MFSSGSILLFLAVIAQNGVNALNRATPGCCGRCELRPAFSGNPFEFASAPNSNYGLDVISTDPRLNGQPVQVFNGEWMGAGFKSSEVMSIPWFEGTASNGYLGFMFPKTGMFSYWGYAQPSFHPEIKDILFEKVPGGRHTCLQPRNLDQNWFTARPDPYGLVYLHHVNAANEFFAYPHSIGDGSADNQGYHIRLHSSGENPMAAIPIKVVLRYIGDGEVGDYYRLTHTEEW